MARRHAVSLTLIELARDAKSTPALVNLATRARERAQCYARVLADWPLLVETVERDAKEIEAMFYARRGTR